jgi:hypothetical protein
MGEGGVLSGGGQAYGESRMTITYVEDVLVCPATRKRLSFDWTNALVRVEGTDVSYPITDRIVDFLL